RQARWMEKIAEFNFTVEYVWGVENVLADALLCIYSNKQPGTVRALSEYAQYDNEDNPPLVGIESFAMTMPVLVDTEACVAIALIKEATEGLRCSTRLCTRDAVSGTVASQIACPAAQTKAVQVKYSCNAPQSEPHTADQVPHDTPPHDASASILTSATEAGTVATLVAAPKPCKPCVPPPPPETGQLETSCKFLKQIHRVVLDGPRENGQEGAGHPHQPSQADAADKETPTAPVQTPDTD
ncbi:hypothetical protein C8Q80DRAFT_1101017, partial [Daedaleopsis nitida]